MREVPEVRASAGLTDRPSAGTLGRCLRIAGAAVALTLAAAGCTKPDPAQGAAETTIVSIVPDGQVAMPPKDSALVATGHEVARIMASSGDIWPGFAPEAILLYWPHAPFPAVLVTAKSPPIEWRAVVAAGTSGFPAVHFRTGPLRGLVGNIALDYRIGDLSATAVTLDATVAGALDFAFHEAFHSFQRATFATALRGDPVIPDSLVADPEFLALQEVELPLLRAALEEPRPERRTARLQRYLAVRRARLQRVDPSVGMAERHWELIEGSATWVGLKAATLASPTARRDLAREVVGRELRDLLPHQQGGLSERVVYRRSRGTGVALMAILDDAGADWRRVAESGHALDELLARTLGQASGSDKELVSEAKRAAGYDTLLAMTRSWVDTLSAGTVREQFEGRPGDRIVIDLDAVPSGDGRVRFPTYNSSGRARSADPTTTIYLPVESFSIDEPGLLLTARGADLMVERRAMDPLRLTLVVDELPAFPRRRSFRAGELTLSGHNFDLKASRATVNKESDRVLHVAIRR